MTEIAAFLLGLGILLALIRLVRGPYLPNRVVALDLITTIGIGMVAVFAVMTDQLVYLDIAVVLALVSYLGTIAFAFYLERP